MAASPRPISESVPVLVLPQGYARRIAFVPDNYNASIQMRDIAKTAEPLTSAAETANVMRRAFTALRNGRLRPAIVELPWDVLKEDVPEPLDYRPVVRTRSAPDPDAVRSRRRHAHQGKAPGDLCRAGRPLGLRL